MHSKVKISSKGQIVIPSKIRKSLNTDLLEIVLEKNRIILRPVKSVLDIAGNLNKYAKNAGKNARELENTVWKKHAEEKFNRT